MSKVPVFLFLLIPILSWGQSFDSVVDYSLDLSGLDSPAAAERAVADGRIVILEGMMQDVEVGGSGRPEVFFILVNGSWIGTDDVRAYSCIVRFTGEEWLKRFQPGNTEIPADQRIPQGSRLLIAARVTGYDRDAGMAVADGTALRILR